MVAGARRAPVRKVIQLRVSLKGHDPSIWRRLVVPGGIDLSKLHSVLQAAMGWEDRHLHLFRIGETTYGPPDDECDVEDPDEIDESTVALVEVVEPGLVVDYDYDFGDGWEHEVLIEAIDVIPLTLKFAVCIDGQRACPPEDCGGTRGFEALLEAVADPGHGEYDEYLDWIGPHYDPGAFSVAAANASLQRVR